VLQRNNVADVAAQRNVARDVNHAGWIAGDEGGYLRGHGVLEPACAETEELDEARCGLVSKELNGAVVFGGQALLEVEGGLAEAGVVGEVVMLALRETVLHVGATEAF
jgi:hypothetical protein